MCSYFTPSVLLPVQQIFLLKEILLHQGTCPTNVCHSTGGGESNSTTTVNAALSEMHNTLPAQNTLLKIHYMSYDSIMQLLCVLSHTTIT